MKSEILDYYTQRELLCEENIAKYNRSINTYSALRLLTIVGGFILIYQVLAVRSISLTFAAFFFIIIIFALLVKKHSVLYDKREYYKNLKTINNNEIHNILYRSNLYPDGFSWNDEKHPYSADLDIFGSGSLFHLLNRTATHAGSQKLARWIGGSASLAEIQNRQEAVKELAKKKEWAQDIRARLLFHLQKDEELTRFFAFLEKPAVFTAKSILKHYVAAAPYIFALALILTVVFKPAQLLLILLGLVNGGMVFYHMARINQTDRLVSKAGAVLESSAGIFKQLESETWTSKLSIKLHSDLVAHGGENLSGRIRSLSALINKLDYRLNIFVSIILNYIFVWDLRQVFALEAWKTSNKHELEVAFEVVAEFEALLSLASLHQNNSDWAFPVITDPANYTLDARGLGHPLISGESRIINDFTLQNDRVIEIVTGSNMAGKSTFLRTVGINAVLAFAGAPVCAEHLEISLMKVVTYMRIKDSLNESTSTFKAELDRLQMILKVSESGEKAYFLIDEMLRGTNSVDKYRGSVAVIRKLLAERAAGMVATHDLQLARLEEEHPGHVRNYHFDIQIVNGEMKFDYKLKTGECSTFNASILLKKIGIEVT